MSTLKTIAVVLGSLIPCAGFAQPQSLPSDPTAQPNMATPAGQATSLVPPSEAMAPRPPPPISPMDRNVMQGCAAMPRNAMTADPQCRLVLAKHPEMRNPDGTVKTQPR